MSRIKGNSAEREVAALLEHWWKELEPDARFVRTPLSGGWGNADLRAGFRSSGDLMTTAKLFPFTVEVKRRENWVWKTVLDGRPSPVWGWWKQAQTQASEMKEEPLLWFRKNREGWHILMSETYAEQMQVIPRTVWSDGLDNVDYGEILPCLIKANDFLRAEPSKFAKVLF